MHDFCCCTDTNTLNAHTFNTCSRLVLAGAGKFQRTAGVTHIFYTYIHMHVKMTCYLSLCSHDRLLSLHQLQRVAVDADNKSSSHAYVHVYMCVRVCVCVPIFMYVCMYHTNVCMYVYMYVCIYVHIVS
jgi:hypothetical protein